MKRLPAEYIL